MGRRQVVCPVIGRPARPVSCSLATSSLVTVQFREAHRSSVLPSQLKWRSVAVKTAVGQVRVPPNLADSVSHVQEQQRPCRQLLTGATVYGMCSVWASLLLGRLWCGACQSALEATMF
ncbi:unnamed protein product [Ostreobium quekettii]|uniref:Uncharacterized protein n=1 Tax=Ostreobium quekettii TaxID=121088 RepID=A0A8S1JE81_9CHLO|nr:unnamed protein product [Ostreobium quekettii]